MDKERFYETDYIRALEKDKELCIIVLGKKYLDSVGVCGILGEVISRKKGVCEYYNMGTIASMSCINDEPFTLDVDEPKAYIFRVWDIAKINVEGQPMIITGKAGEYNIPANKVDDLSISLQFRIKEVPEYKNRDSVEVKSVDKLRPGNRLDDIVSIASDNDAILQIEDIKNEDGDEDD